ncbi:ThuA domain-containing protein [Chitinophaga sp. MM2321]|uniref:ThuA domain-containing protein n=1 Tax=Chitinophaga sp. MM2321 TaxID=3137178 RepID=UPI0032D56E6F
MKKHLIIYSLTILAVVLVLTGCNKRAGNPKVLVFTKTSAFRHAFIDERANAVVKIGKENGFEVDTTSDAERFTEAALKDYAAVVFFNTADTADVLLDNYQKNAFQRYIQAGGGFVGIHTAIEAGSHWGWYRRLVGENSYKDTANGYDHPATWYQEYDGGRAWCMALSPTEELYNDSSYLKHILDGIKYAVGENKVLNYAKATTPPVPEEDRFAKVQLVDGVFFEPTEMTILPNLDILVAQRRGEIMVYKDDTKSVKQAGFLNVYWKTGNSGVNAEEGLMGIQKDPDFAKNNFIYAYYSPADTSVNRLSRFTYTNDSIDVKSERILLQFYSQREICCHTGGSIAFGDNRMLYLSTGDNTTPFNEPNQPFVSHGYAPMDDRPGHEQFDARRSAGNTNDLRGKILRIRVNEDGSYTIPDNNLFPKGTENARPEIFVMGNRNPYRISIDQKKGFLYWGEVGPDAKNDSMETRGPRGYDEINQAREAGFFGWPFFVGNNIPYVAYDYATGESGLPFDPGKPINNSRNNTGLQQLPPAKPAFIWYPYGVSKEFPQVGSGGRTAMAGPVYYTDLYPKKTRMPDYYHNKFFIYEWVRGWIKVLTLLPNGDFDSMEPFMLSTKFANPSDMEVGPDGRIYILEYGSGWFSKNANAGLARIDYIAGNRPPKATAIKVDKTSGALPFQITAQVTAKDPENDKITYIWHIDDGTTKETSGPKLQHTFNKEGDYAIWVEVKDDKNASSKSSVVSVYAGNEAPAVNIKIDGNKTFYFPGKEVKYEVVVSDKEDGKNIDLGNLIVSAEYHSRTGKAGSSQGHQTLSRAMMGRNKMLTLDCMSCHKVDEKSVGPSFTAISQRYKPGSKSVTHLAEKVMEGGSGAWGPVAMPAHPDLKESDAKLITSWILSLNLQLKSLPPKGAVNTALNKPVTEEGDLYISATYTDRGGMNSKPLMGNKSLILKNPKITFDEINIMQGFSKSIINGSSYMMLPPAGGWVGIGNIDLSGISRAALTLGWEKTPVAGCVLEIRMDAPDGKKIGEFSFAGKGQNHEESAAAVQLDFITLTADLTHENDGKQHNIYLVSKANDAKIPNDMMLSHIQFFLK